MAIEWNRVRPALLALLASLSGLQTVWIDKRRPYIDPRGQAVTLLRVRSTAAIGVDDRRYVDLGEPAPNPTLVETQNGNRRVRLDVRVESFRHDDDRFSFNAIEDIRAKLRFRSSLARLRAVNVSLVSLGEALDLTGVIQDDRVTSVAVLEVTLNVGICVADSDNPEFNIETVELDDDRIVYNPPC